MAQITKIFAIIAKRLDIILTTQSVALPATRPGGRTPSRNRILQRAMLVDVRLPEGFSMPLKGLFKPRKILKKIK